MQQPCRLYKEDQMKAKELNKNKKFEVGRKYIYSDWFTGGRQVYTCTNRTDDTVTFSLTSYESDGIHINEKTYSISRENDNEKVVLFTYKGFDCIIDAGE